MELGPTEIGGVGPSVGRDALRRVLKTDSSKQIYYMLFYMHADSDIGGRRRSVGLCANETGASGAGASPPRNGNSRGEIFRMRFWW